MLNASVHLLAGFIEQPKLHIYKIVGPYQTGVALTFWKWRLGVQQLEGNAICTSFYKNILLSFCLSVLSKAIHFFFKPPMTFLLLHHHHFVFSQIFWRKIQKHFRNFVSLIFTTFLPVEQGTELDHANLKENAVSCLPGVDLSLCRVSGMKGQFIF